jgi:N,N'-diacetyllegionaminate synthase
MGMVTDMGMKKTDRVTMNSSIFIIAEIAQAHEGSLGIAHSYIDALASSGINAVKFQTHIAEAESSPLEPFRVKFSYEDETRYDYWKRMEFTEAQWLGLKEHCDKVGIEFLSSPFSNQAVDLLERIGVQRYKIGSGEVTNLLLLERIAKTRKPVIVSSGMSSFPEVKQAVQFLQERGSPVSLLQCTTAYPTRPEEWGLNVMSEFRKSFDLPVGFSDHSGDIYACLAAAALGAKIIEFHVVFDKKMFGPDAKASLTLMEVERLVNGIRQIESSLATLVDKSDTGRYDQLKTMFGKTLAVNKALVEGHVITFEDLESKKPAGVGIPAADFKKVLGRKVIRAKRAYDFLTNDDVE